MDPESRTHNNDNLGVSSLPHLAAKGNLPLAMNRPISFRALSPVLPGDWG
jgi:hypothetical protein